MFATARRKASAEVEKASTEKTGLRSDVVTLYQGGQYHLYTYKKYTDVRLVFAPVFDVAFFGGLLSSLDFLLNMPMSEVVERLPLEDTIRRALVSREGELGRIIDTVTAYEVADLEALASSPIELSDLAPAYLNAIAWSMSVTAEAVNT